MPVRMSLWGLVLASLLVGPAGAQNPGAGSSSKDEATRQREEIDRLQKELAESKRRIEQQDRLIAEMKEAGRLREQLAEAVRKVAEQEKTIQQLRDKLVQVQIEVETFRQRTQQLEEALRNFAKQADKLGTKPEPARPRSNPPAEHVEGVVKAVDGKSGLLTISLGSKAGLRAGHTLEVFRLAPEARYLGTIEIVEVREEEAVAKPVASKVRMPTQAGDRVVSRILGG